MGNVKADYIAKALAEAKARGQSDLDLDALERNLKQLAADDKVNLDRFGRKYTGNSLGGSKKYTRDLLRSDPKLRNLAQQVMDPDVLAPGNKGSRRNSSRHSGFGRNDPRRKNSGYNGPGRNPSGRRTSTEDGPIAYYRRGLPSFSLRGLLESPWGKMLLIILALVLVYCLFGESVYAFFTSGLPFQVLLAVLGILAVLGFLRANMPAGVKAMVIGAVVLVGVYKVLGPGIYAFLTSGAVFKGILAVLAAGGSFALLTARINLPFLVRLGILAAVWMAILNH